MYLVYDHANIVNQLLHDQKITIVDKWLILALMLIVFFFTTWYTWRLKPLYNGTV